MPSFFLKAPNGKHPVGVTTFVSPVQAPHKIGNAKIRSGNDLVPALSLEEIAFTAYYPAHTEESERSRYGLHWIPRPLHHSARGYARFSRVAAAFVWPVIYLFSMIKVPAFENAPLMNPSSRDSRADDRRAWPLVIFSHGLGGGRTTYSQICTRLAASGKVVIAMEHRDGTGPVVVTSAGKAKLYIQNDDVVWDEENSTDPLPLRAEQLLFRRHEIYQAYMAFRQLVQGHRKESKLSTIDRTEIDWASWEGTVDCDKNVGIVGHSFGGTTLLSILSTPPPEATYPPLPITRAVALDPWLEPFASPGPIPYVPPSLTSPQLLVINGEGFTLWKENFVLLEPLMKVWTPQGRRLFTIVRGRHHFFSDFYLLPLVKLLKPTAEPVMDVIAKLCIAFIEGKEEEALEEVRTREMAFEWYEEKGQRKRRIVGGVADVVVH